MVASWPVEQPILTAFSFIGFLLSVVPLCWQLEAWNIGCSLYGMWTGIICLIQFVDHVVWRNDAINRAPVWCDISTRVAFIARIGIIAASLVIARRVAKITTGSGIHASPTFDGRRQMIYTDLAIGLSFPLAQLIIFYFIQGHRFDIFEGVGCIWAIPNAIHTYFLSIAWPIPMGLASATYCVITLRALRQRQNSLRDILGHNSGITTHRYFRLLAISVIEILCTVPLATYVVIYDAVVLPIYPWRGLADLHYGFSRIDQYPISLWTTQPPIQRSIEINEWIVIGCAILYFLLFGLTEEARKHYKSAFNLVAGVVGLPTTKYARNNVRFQSTTISFAHSLPLSERLSQNQEKGALTSAVGSTMFENTLASGTTPCRGDNDEPYSYEVAATSKEVVDSSRNDEETPDAVVFVQLTPADPQHGSDNHPIKHDYPPEAV